MRITAKFAALVLTVVIAPTPVGATALQDRMAAVDSPLMEYSDRMAPLSVRAGLEVDEVPLEMALRTLRATSGVSVIFNPVLLPLTARQGTITGRVVDAATGALISAAQVHIPALGIGALTENSGRYALIDVPGGTHTIVVQRIGYRTVSQEVSLSPEETVQLDFELRETALALDGIVVTGTPGEQQVRSLGNVVTRLDASSLEEIAPSPDVQRMLSAAPGLRAMTAGGAIGQGSVIRIRGSSSLSLRSDPLLYVDGVRVNNSAADVGMAAVGVDRERPPSRINDLNPADIESIEVIKGPAAATLYGTEASNGVINVITKKGSRGAPRFNFTIKQGANWLPDPENLFPVQYYRCRGIGDCAAGEIVAHNILREDRIRYGNVWFRTGHRQAYEANLSGGGDDVRYYFSAAWNEDQGPVSYNWQDKFSGRTNLNWTPNETLDIQFNLGLVRSETQTASPVQPVTAQLVWGCAAPGCEEGGGSMAVDGPLRGYLSEVPEWFENDVEGFEYVQRSTVGVTVSHDPVDWFDHRFTVGGDFTNVRGTDLIRRSLPDAPGRQRAGRRRIQNQITNYTSLDYGATGTFGLSNSLTSSTSVGAQYYLRQTDMSFSSGEIFPARQMETISASATRTSNDAFFENKTLGLYVQEQVSWENRVFVTAAVRGDDNSAFGEDFEFVIYPKFQASYVISEEPFLRDIWFLDQARLRAAWGKAGQQPDVFAAVRTYSPRPAGGGISIFTPENTGNPDLKPEVGEEIEAGFDASFLGERLALDFTYYSQTKTDAIVNMPVSPSLGFPGTQFRNLGEIHNQGVELAVGVRPYESPTMDVSLNFSFSSNRNKVVSTGIGAPLTSTSDMQEFHVDGYPLGSIFRKRVVGSDIIGQGADAQATNVMCEGGDIIAGTNNLSEGGGAAVPCAQAPQVLWGDAQPRWEGNVSAEVGLFDNLRLYSEVDFVGGYTIISSDVGAAHIWFSQSLAAIERTDPVLLGYEALGDLWTPGVMDGGFAKLRRVSLAYSLPQALSTRIGAANTSVTFSAENLWTIWVAQEESFGRKHMDPEVRMNAGRGNDPGGLTAYHREGWPQMKRLLLTLRTTF
ncbi:MAG: SusC/RagA family TonB-linked outer membrane protein [Dehalococcoidia bacterium]